jgi:hypothetical protein
MSKQRVFALLFAGLIAGGGGMGVAQADPGHNSAGPNGHNDHGICTAYFNGLKVGHEQGNSPGPFGALEDRFDDDTQDIYNFCSTIPSPGSSEPIGGNPDENGRFTDCFDDGDCDNGSP